MTDVRAPEADPFESAAEPDEQGPRNRDPASGTFGLADWLKWGWRQLTSMRTALILLFLLALASVPGSVLPQQSIDPAAVTQYYQSHPALAPVLNRLSLFSVFAAPWFAAIYLLLFASLAGCVLPRTFRLAGSARQRPPRCRWTPSPKRRSGCRSGISCLAAIYCSVIVCPPACSVWRSSSP